MNIMHTITVSTYRPSYRMWEQSQRRIVRPYKLTYKGAERILRKEAREYGNEFEGSVVHIETAIFGR